MDVTPILALFRILANEFASVEDAVVSAWIQITAPLVSRKRFRKLWTQALALLTAHRMKMAGVGLAAANSIPALSGVDAAIASGVASYSEGDASISLNTSRYSSSPAKDAEYAQTVYGIEYLSLRSMVIMPITSAGEAG